MPCTPRGALAQCHWVQLGFRFGCGFVAGCRDPVWPGRVTTATWEGLVCRLRGRVCRPKGLHSLSTRAMPCICAAKPMDAHHNMSAALHHPPHCSPAAVSLQSQARWPLRQPRPAHPAGRPAHACPGHRVQRRGGAAHGSHKHIRLVRVYIRIKHNNWRLLDGTWAQGSVLYSLGI